MVEIGKVVCEECGWEGWNHELDKVQDPKPLYNTTPDIWSICPACRIPENIRVVCDESGCWKKVSCGTSTPEGYRNTCHEHSPYFKDNEA